MVPNIFQLILPSLRTTNLVLGNFAIRDLGLLSFRDGSFAEVRLVGSILRCYLFVTKARVVRRR